MVAYSAFGEGKLAHWRRLLWRQTERTKRRKDDEGGGWLVDQMVCEHEWPFSPWYVASSPATITCQISNQPSTSRPLRRLTVNTPSAAAVCEIVRDRGRFLSLLLFRFHIKREAQVVKGSRPSGTGSSKALGLPTLGYTVYVAQSSALRQAGKMRNIEKRRKVREM